jgi:hypothetical protein
LYGMVVSLFIKPTTIKRSSVAFGRGYINGNVAIMRSMSLKATAAYNMVWRFLLGSYVALLRHLLGSRLLLNVLTGFLWEHLSDC